MSLPAREQQVLDGIETVLQTGEGRLTSMFVLFTRLADDEEKPGTEDLGPTHATGRRTWDIRRRSTSAGQQVTGRPSVLWRMVVPLVVAIAALVFAALLAMSAASARPCRPVIVAHSSGSALSQPRTCQSSQSGPTPKLVP